MGILIYYNIIINFLNILVPRYYIEAIGLIGLTLITYGAICLIKPLTKSNREINAISSYRNSGAIMGMGHTLEVNENLKKHLEDDRNTGFRGAMFIFIGFSIQLFEKTILIVYFNQLPSFRLSYFYLIILILAFFVIDFNILRRMKLKKMTYLNR